MWYIVGFILISLVVTCIAYRMYPHDVTIQEILVGITIQGVVISIVYFGGVHSAGQDIQILNGVAKEVNRDVKASEEDDFVSTAKASNTEAVLKLEVVKHIIAVKKQENEDKLQASEKKAKRETILAALANKQNEQINNASVEELTAMLNSL